MSLFVTKTADFSQTWYATIPHLRFTCLDRKIRTARAPISQITLMRSGIDFFQNCRLNYTAHQVSTHNAEHQRVEWILRSRANSRCVRLSAFLHVRCGKPFNTADLTAEHAPCARLVKTHCSIKARADSGHFLVYATRSKSKKNVSGSFSINL